MPTDQKLTALLISNPIDLDPGDLLYSVEDTGASPASGGAKAAQVMLTRYKISVTVSANDLIVALVHEDGTSPSTDRPLYFKIGNSLRSVTAALSVTVADGANSFNSGSAELATLLVGYFVYLSYRTASSAVVIGFSRIPYASLYSHFSGTATNEKYGAFSTAPASTDEVINIGYFEATLSVGAGYTWTVPTFTNANLKSEPTFETGWLTWAPVYSGSGSLTYTSVTSTLAKYKIRNDMIKVLLRCTGTTGGTTSTSISFTLPIDDINASYSAGYGNVIDPGVGTNEAAQAITISGTPDTVRVRRTSTTNWGLGAGCILAIGADFQI